MTSTINDHLVSKNAKDRYLRWNQDLKKAEAKLAAAAANAAAKHTEKESRSPTPGDYDKAANPAGETQRRDHASAILTGTWNEGQPDSPHDATPVAEIASPIITSTQATARSPSTQRDTTSRHKHSDRRALGFMTTAFQSRQSQSPSKRPRMRKSLSDEASCRSESPDGSKGLFAPTSPHDGYASADYGLEDVDDEEMHEVDEQLDEDNQQGGVKRPASDLDMDLVTDTIGAIAIDLRGNIAAGSSSGGIGMKHKGRIGPAALVGIGTAVIPEDPKDGDQASVAAVTSGTGEHIATSLASAKCAERLFNGTRRGPGGRSIEELDEHTLMESFILDDFMGHPGVRNQPSAGAIGVMAVKKERTGIYFYFAHNTDSFALASMSSTEREPMCVMSRLGETRSVAQGGRKIRVD